jgi:hypothetical protein
MIAAKNGQEKARNNPTTPMTTDTALTIMCGLAATRTAHQRNATVPSPNTRIFHGWALGPTAFKM